MKRVYVFWLLAGLIFSQGIHAQEDQKQKSSSRFKVLTFNIYHGEKHYAEAQDKDRSNVEIVIRLIDSLKPDLVALQEVDVFSRRAGKRDLLTEIAYRTKMIPAFGKTMDFDGGAYGVGILSAFPLLYTKVHPLFWAEGTEPRVALESIVRIPSGDSIRFVCTHLDHTGKDNCRTKQAEMLIDLFSKDKMPGLLAGDLNSTPDSETLTVLRKYWTISEKNLNPTSPSDRPRHKIDYILYGPRGGWNLVESKVIDEKVASDHNPVFSIFTVKNN